MTGTLVFALTAVVALEAGAIVRLLRQQVDAAAARLRAPEGPGE